MEKKVAKSGITMEQFKEQLESWRNLKKPRPRMPEALWEAAAELAEQYTVGKIAEQFSLHHRRLKNLVQERIAKREREGVKEEEFIEVGIVGKGSEQNRNPEYELEVTDGRGKVARLRVEGIGALQFVELWREALRSMS